MKTNKKFIFRIGVVTIITALSISIVLSQMIFTIKVFPTEVQCIRWDATFVSLEATVERYNNNTLSDTEYAYSFTGELPSNNPDDYINIYCYFDVKNISCIDQYSINGTLKSSSKYAENILFVSNANAAFTTHLFRNSTESAYIVLDVYIGNLNEEQIQELVQGLTITVKAYGDLFGSRIKEATFNKCENVLMDL